MIKRFLSSLSDEELSSLTAMIHEEHEKRISRNVVSGLYPDPSVLEIEMYQNRERIRAIRQYRDRTRLPLKVAKLVLEQKNDPMRVV